MATKSFLTKTQTEEANKVLNPINENLEFSLWLSEKLLERLQESKYWQVSQPVALGSWSRDELAPRSDIDLLFAGPEEEVIKLVEELQEEGVKLRYRVPADPNDWTKGVESFDVLAVYFGKALCPQVHDRLIEQKELIEQNKKYWLKNIREAMIQERKLRSKRHDSISNYLEPNIKYGPGGLRDLQQALYIYELFPEKFLDQPTPLEILKKYKTFFLTIRQKLHLLGGGDVLQSVFQKEIAEWFGENQFSQFMKELQIGLSEVSFYADWVVERAKSSAKKLKQVEELKFEKLADLFKALDKSPSILVQNRVRRNLDKNAKVYKRDPHKVGALLNKYFVPGQKEVFLESLFRSQILENFIPELHRVKGLVQHDQYHRYTVDAHLLQAVKQIKRVLVKPSLLGRLAPLVKKLTDADKKALLWTALYHDLAKGRGDKHSERGAEVVKKDFTRMGLSLRLTVEVAWLVKSHLLLSTAAFRKNPQSPSTWKELHQQGVAKQRLACLAIFTAVDIIATNPEAWNQWKERLLADLVKTLQSPKATKFMKLLAKAQAVKLKISSDFIKYLDPSMVEEVPTKYLLEDYQYLKKNKGSMPPLILRSQSNELWVRFHDRKDKPGLFLSYVHLLHGAGCNILGSTVNTFKAYGAYDWFKVKTNKTPTQLKKLFELLKEQDFQIPKVCFDKITIVSEDKEEAIISFRGKNQSGALIAAAKVLYDNDLPIKWAKVHTWGRQIDDVFCVQRQKDMDNALDSMREVLVNLNKDKVYF